MGSKPSSQPILEIEANEQPTLPWKVLERIVPFLDAKQFFLTLPFVCTFSLNLYRNTILYEKYMFCGNRITHHMSQLYTNVQDIRELRCFRSNANLSLEDVTQPKEIQIDVFITSGREEIYLNEISSMVIEMSTLDGTLNDVPRMVSNFLGKLFGTRFGNLKNLGLSRFRANGSLWTLLFKLNIDCLHWTVSNMIAHLLPGSKDFI